MDNAQKLAVLPMWVIDRIKEEMRLSPATWQTIMAAVEQAEVPQTLPCEVKLPPGTVIGKGVPVSTLMLAIAQRERYQGHARSFAEQHQIEPVAWRGINELGEVVTEWIDGTPPSSMVDLSGNPASFARIERAYTHADPDEASKWRNEAHRFNLEVERLRKENEAFDAGMRNLACQLSAGGYNAESLTADQLLEKVQWGLTHLTEAQARLVAQLQADMTERDEQIDALRQGMKGDYDLDAWLAFVEEAPQLRMDAGRYRWLRSRDLEAISQGGVFAGLTPDNLVLNEETLDQAIDAAMAPDYVEASTHGRLNGIPKEPCSGCGTPGWTGACNKCIPY